jgi:hypothetical protein
MFMCRRCLLADESATPCPQCGRERPLVRPGEAADPVRRPMIDREGNVRTRAPLWWLRETVADLTRWLEVQ